MNNDIPPSTQEQTVAFQKPKRRPLRAVLTALLVIALIAAAGAGAYFWVENESLKADLSNKDTEIESLNTENSRIETPVQGDDDTDGTLVAIKELGISVNVPKSISDLTYSYSSNERGSYVSLSTKTLTDNYKDNEQCASANGPLGIISKAEGVYPKDANVMNSTGVLLKQFEDYYIAYASPQSSCSTGDGTLQSDQAKVVRESLSTVTELDK